MKNYYVPFIENYLEQTLEITGKMRLSSSFLNQRKIQLLEERKENDMLFDSINTYRDLSLIKADMNHFSPDYRFTVTIANLESEVESIVNEHNCYAVAQSYELIEGFLVEVVTEYFFRHQDELENHKLDDTKIPLTKVEIRSIINKRKGTNNKGLIAIIRKVSPFFREFENKNIYNVKICEWFDLVSMIRHTLTHNRQALTPEFLQYINSRKANEMFDNQFKRRQVRNKICIYIETDRANDVINWLNTFAHFIFKALSLKDELPLAITQYWG